MLRIVAIVALVAAVLFGTTPTPASAAQHTIDVNLTTLQATALDGGVPVYTAPITAGRAGFETPTGNFAVERRVRSETMDSSTIGIPRDAPGGYYLTGVDYTQYIVDGVALHANYWQPDSVFGTMNTSHGCIGMREGDAAYFWSFATYGTPVSVHY